MSYRFVRLLVFFDLGMTTDSELKAYRKFRKFLLQEGFIMFQYSVYVKLVINQETAKLYRNKVYKQVPSNGLVSILQITEKQFARMEQLVGNIEQCEIADERRVLIF